MKWEKETFYVKRDERTGAILRLEEVMPYEYMIEEQKRFKQARRELEERRIVRKMNVIGD